jgi:trans-AT polyketide synthase, acyltransferase and oxidoreductase domains
LQTVFLFPGHGSHYPRMGIELYEGDRVFRDTMQALNEVATGLIGRSLIQVLYSKAESSEPAIGTVLGHTATFSVQYALTRSLIVRGLVADVALGMSLGEFVAAAAFDMLEGERALRIIIRQARTVEQRCASGGMLAVFQDPSVLAASPLPHGVELACCNGRHHFVVSGRAEPIRAFAGQLRERGVISYLLPVEHGFHSQAVEDARLPCLAELRDQALRPASVPIVSASDAERRRVRKPEHFWSAVRGPILFDQAVRVLGDLRDCVLVDVGPSGTVAGWLRQRGHERVHSILSPGHGDLARLDALTAGSGATRRVPRPFASASASKATAYMFAGQGSQRKGMGARSFALFPDLTRRASELLGYSIEALCLEDVAGRLSQTRYAQPALFVVSALAYLEIEGRGGRAAYFAGHSLGEYCALFAAGSFDFESGLRLVQRRAELMAQAEGGAMAAVLGLRPEQVGRMLISSGELSALDVANVNSPRQVVVSGPSADVERARAVFVGAGATTVVPLRVSGAFHSRYMQAAARAFECFLATFELVPPRVPVVSNVEGRPHAGGRTRELLATQLTHPVQWLTTIRYLRAQPEVDFKELGGSRVLTKLLEEIETLDALDSPSKRAGE